MTDQGTETPEDPMHSPPPSESNDRRATPGSARRPFPAFSLVEMLVTVAATALLVSWLLPSLHAARLSARDVACGANVRQMGQAALAYNTDHDGWIFPLKETVPDQGTRWWFGLEPAGGPTREGQRLLDRTRGQLWPYYLVADSIEVCPAFARHSPDYKPKFTTDWTTYGHPLKLMNPAEPARVQRMTRPADTVVFADAAQVNRFQPPATPARPRFEQWYYIARAEATMHYVHKGNGGGNANGAMYDGHVRALAPTTGPIDLFPEAPIGRPPGDVLLQID